MRGYSILDRSPRSFHDGSSLHESSAKLLSRSEEQNQKCIGNSSLVLHFSDALGSSGRSGPDPQKASDACLLDGIPDGGSQVETGISLQAELRSLTPFDGCGLGLTPFLAVSTGWLRWLPT